MIPTGYTQSAWSSPGLPNPNPQQLSLIGDPVPAAQYERKMGIQRAMFPDKFPTYKGPTGPLYANGGA